MLPVKDHYPCFHTHLRPPIRGVAAEFAALGRAQSSNATTRTDSNRNISAPRVPPAFVLRYPPAEGSIMFIYVGGDIVSVAIASGGGPLYSPGVRQKPLAFP